MTVFDLGRHPLRTQDLLPARLPSLIGPRHRVSVRRDVFDALRAACPAATPERAQRARLYAVDVIVDDDQPEPVRVLGPDGG